MAFVSITPSLDLQPGNDIISFSHISLHHKEAGVQTDQSCQIVLSRDIYTQQDVDEIQHRQKTGRSGPKPRCSWQCLKKSMIALVKYVFPVLGVLKKYDLRDYILGDFLSGISVACLHFPQGLAYGILASLSPVQGLYTSFFPVLFYVAFGTVQHMAIGTDSIVAIMVAEIVETEAAKEFKMNNVDDLALNVTGATGNQILDYKTGVSMTITLLCGCLLVAMALCQLGFLTTYQSKSFIGGFTTAAAFHIFTSQVPKALGITVPLVKGIGKMVKLYIAIVENIQNTNLASVIVVVICMVFIVLIKDFINDRYRAKMKFSIPADLLAIIIATVISKFAKLGDRFGIELVGNIPSGIPFPRAPSIETVPSIFVQSLQIAVLIFFLSIAMVKVCAEKHEYEVRDNQELLAYGLTNICCSFFPCFPPSTSPPRNMILSSMGSRTTMNGVFTCVVMVLVLMVLGELFTSLPVPALAAMIFVSVKPLLLQVLSLPKIFRINKLDFLIWILSCLGGILMDVPYGLMIGIGASFITVVVHSQTAHLVPLFYHSDHQIFVSERSDEFLDQLQMNNIFICRLNTSLYFATADRFRRMLAMNPLKKQYSATSASAKMSEKSLYSLRSGSTAQVSSAEYHPHAYKPSQEGIKLIILECSCVSYVDLQGVNTLSVVFEEYRRVGVAVLLAKCNKHMWTTLKRSGFFDVVSTETVFYDLDDAFHAAKLLLS